MKNKKIFFVADAKSIHTAKWVDYFISKNYKVYLATFAKVNNTACDNIYFLSDINSSVKGGNYYYLFSIFKLSKLFKEIKPEIINAHFSYSLGLIALIAKNISNTEANFSVVCHGSDVLSPPKPFIFDFVNKYVLENSDKIFAVSDQIKDKIESFGIETDKIFVGQYGIDLQIEDNFTKDIDILSNRAYIPNSRINFLLNSIDDLEDHNLNIVFVVPNISDSDFDKISINYSYITFYKELEYDTMMNLVSRAKVYISATKSDGTSLSLLEAMKYKTIPIVSNIISNRSWIIDSVNGYLFNGKTDLIQKLKQALSIESQDMKKMQDINIDLLKNKSEYNKQMKKIEIFFTEN